MGKTTRQVNSTRRVSIGAAELVREDENFDEKKKKFKGDNDDSKQGNKKKEMSEGLKIEGLNEGLKEDLNHKEKEAGNESSAALVQYMIAHFCRSSPCQNGGTCYGKNGTPYCACPDGFVGDKCQSE